ncbi:hypothetical protein [Corynebacterium epidermidicanis]|uniref:Uncharacterized protein n=1 Tax=Corynebacterium epidermidicanis TaxID=1050174 RepID=A0A0G3GRZ9_9CORY|nr:hypothetical protein [Corynebacterium epidermidicanis]AKK03335.1 hypothetical protein CEPID_07420 [Corynebacterium epidermidicanis]
MKKPIYQALSQIFAVLFLIVGCGAMFGGNYAHSFVTEQLTQEKITMPEGAAITSLKNPDAQAALQPFAGQPLTTGEQAKAYADNFIWEHMMASANGRTYQELGDDIKKAKADGKSEEEIKKLNDARETSFKGDTLRGILLSAYGWWLVGTIALYAGVAMIVVAVLLALAAATVLRTKRA